MIEQLDVLVMLVPHTYPSMMRAIHFGAGAIMLRAGAEKW
jgi:hypothetical protein